MSRLRMVWIGLVAGAILYTVLLMMLPTAGAAPDSAVVIALAAAALSMVAASQLVGRRMHAAAVRGIGDDALEIEAGPDPAAAGAHFREAGPQQRRAREPEAARRLAIRIYQSPLIVSLALADGAAVIGLVLGLLGVERAIALGLVGLGAAAMALLAPTPDRVFGPVEERLGITLRDPSPPR